MKKMRRVRELVSEKYNTMNIVVLNIVFNTVVLLAYLYYKYPQLFKPSVNVATSHKCHVRAKYLLEED